MKQTGKQKNYIAHTFLFAFFTMLILICMWFLPEFNFGQSLTRKVNVLSDLVDNETLEQFFVSPTSDKEYADNKQNITSNDEEEQSYVVEIPCDAVVDKKSITVQCGATLSEQSSKDVTENSVVADTIQTNATQKQSVQPKELVGGNTQNVKPVVVENNSEIPPVENINNPKFAKFIGKLKSGKRVRIAVAGDSFIEGDIFTQDIREMLQQKYGGSGVGFMPITSQVAGFRQTIEHKFSGWTTKSVLKNRDNFHLSGYLFYPNEGAWVSYKGSNYRKNLNAFKNARLLFVNKNKTTIDVIVNDTLKMTFNPTAGEQMQAISITKNIKSIKFSFKNVNGFVAYGAVLDGDCGVSVDNYSVRSYSGAALATISAEIARQSDQIIPYDMIILQYGLNVANESNTNYTQYAKKLGEIIYNLQTIMPNTAIMVMSVSDRQSRSNGKTLASIYALEQTQRAVAQKFKVPFWSTLYAMQNAGGMGTFVKKGWAAKDYTHLSAKGGKVVANIFIKALDDNNN